MREIKFRAWDAKSKKMFPIHRMEWDKISNALTYLSGVDIHDKDSDFEGDVFYGGSATKMTGHPLVPQYTVMQYTGLNYKKDNQEVYEDDLCENEGVLYRVIWKDGQFALKVIKTLNVLARGLAFPIVHYLEGDKLICKKVGTVWEHPHLLEGTE